MIKEEPDYRKGEHTKIALMAQDISYIKDAVRDIKTEVESKYVTSDQFEPVKRIVYGLVAIILTMVMAGLMALVVRK